jgi:hypothetical protein
MANSEWKFNHSLLATPHSPSYGFIAPCTLV